MTVKLFVLGRPGSGKSTAARHIHSLFSGKEWRTRHINDYDILRQMFLADTKHLKFRPTEHNGFDAIDLSVLDAALQEVEQRAHAYLPIVDLVSIEFARNDYSEGFKQFSPTFLRDAYILFLDADIDTCLQRVHERVIHAVSKDDHPSFTDDVFRRYYRKENRYYMSRRLRREFDLNKPVKIIRNTGAMEDFLRQVNEFANVLYEQESAFLYADQGWQAKVAY